MNDSWKYSAKWKQIVQSIETQSREYWRPQWAHVPQFLEIQKTIVQSILGRDEFAEYEPILSLVCIGFHVRERCNVYLGFDEMLNLTIDTMCDDEHFTAPTSIETIVDDFLEVIRRNVV